MTRLPLTLTVGILGLVLVGFAIFVLDDRALFVPPAETVARNFVQQLALRRYEPAATCLDERLGAPDLGSHFASYPRKVLQTEVVPLSKGENRAEVRVLLKTEEGQLAHDLSLERDSHGLWRIAGMGKLSRP